MSDTPEYLYRFRPLVVKRRSIVERSQLSGLFINQSIVWSALLENGYLSEEGVVQSVLENIKTDAKISSLMSDADKVKLFEVLKQASKEKTVIDELGSQEVYFSTLEELNDPMDGYQNICFEGDCVLWKNLVKLYLLNLAGNLSFCKITGNDQKLDFSQKLPVFLLKKDVPGDIYERMVKDVFESNLVNELICQLIKRKWSFSEVILVFELFHPLFLNVYSNAMEDILGGKPFPYVKENSQNIEKFIDAFRQEKQSAPLDLLSEIANWEKSDALLWLRRNNECDADGSSVYAENIRNAILGYPRSFFNLLAKAIYPEYAVASFACQDNKTTMWGHYAQGHKGICLIFKSLGREFHPVEYNKIPSEVNVFESMGMFSMSDLYDNWLRFGDKVSSYAGKCYGAEFKEKYWDNFYKKINYKSQEWKHEAEYRLESHRLFPGDKAHKFLNYDFGMLKGIVFGVNTPIETKLSIMELIERKCQQYGRSDFVFKQAEYSSHKNEMYIRKMSIPPLLTSR